MGWRGFLRSAVASSRRAERARISHARQTERQVARARAELIQQHANMQAASELARARHEVQMFENYLELIVSLHKDSWSPWDWNQVANGPPPRPVQHFEGFALAALHAHQPGLIERATGEDKVVRARLESAILVARQQDQALHQQQYAQWDWYRRVGHGVINGDPDAYRAVMDYLMPFEELEDLGTSVSLRSDAPWYVQAEVIVGSSELIPSEERKLLASGKVSVKEMSKTKYWALYQDHVCSAALRVGRELFALLPIRQAFVHVLQPGVDAATGHNRYVPLVSVVFDRERFTNLNFERLDPSEAVGSFNHRMTFKKTSGFVPVEPLVPGDAGPCRP